MQRPPLVAVLLTAAVATLLLLAPSAGAITIHRHVIVHDPVGGLTAGPPVQVPREVVRVVHVAPPDGDEDGVADADDSCPETFGTQDDGCPPPEPVLSTEYAVPSTTATGYVPPATTSAGGCPSYMAAEASSPTDVNPTSGASGCYQVLPSTAAAMGAACSDVNAASCVSAICAAQGNGAWAASGATPCG